MSLELHVRRASTLDVGEGIVSIVPRTRRVLGVSKTPIVAPKSPPIHVSKLPTLDKQRRSVSLPRLFHLNHLLHWPVLPVEELIGESLKLHVLEYGRHVLRAVLFGN